MLYDLIIIGAGPAGLTAAIYARRALIKTLILEKELPGGKLNKTAEVDNYPGFVNISGPELAKKITQHAHNYELDWENKEVIGLRRNELGIFEVKTQEKTYSGQTVIIASGTIENKLRVPGEEEFTNYGVSYCALCDGFLFRNKIIAVVGGGYSAYEAALYLSNIASKVYLLHRGQELRIQRENKEKIQKNSKIEILFHTIVKEIKGEEKKLTHLIIFDSIKKERKILTVSAIFPCIGLIPLTDFTNKQSICDKEGYIKTDDYCATNMPGLFAAGDVSKPARIKQITTAVADGSIAAQSAIQYLKKSLQE